MLNYMPHISSKKLKKEISERIYDRLVKTITGNGTSNGHAVLGELLSPVEQVMLAKRLTAVIMLLQKTSSYKVRKVLGLSSRTTAYIMRDIDSGKYTQVEKLIIKKKDKGQFWADLEVMMRMGMPEMGKNRWKWLDQLDK
jgi:uncharacterized protein YerC